jgi:hypothetical protein
MTEPTTPPTSGETPPEGGTTPETPPAVTAEDVARLQKALDAERELRKGREKELGEFRTQAKASMTEAERQAAEAEERGRLAERSAWGSRLARSEWVAEAARRNPGFDAAGALEDLNLAKFVGEDGEPDGKAIAASVARLVPEADSGPRFGTVDQGPRQTSTTPTGQDMNRLIRQAAGRA